MKFINCLLVTQEFFVMWNEFSGLKFIAKDVRKMSLLVSYWHFYCRCRSTRHRTKKQKLQKINQKNSCKQIFLPELHFGSTSLICAIVLNHSTLYFIICSFSKGLQTCSCTRNSIAVYQFGGTCQLHEKNSFISLNCSQI